MSVDKSGQCGQSKAHGVKNLMLLLRLSYGQFLCRPDPHDPVSPDHDRAVVNNAELGHCFACPGAGPASDRDYLSDVFQNEHSDWS